MNLFEEFRWRGMVQDATEGVEEALSGDPVHAYIGFDPTAASLHVGTLVPIMGLVHLQRAGHHPIILCGGGTGLIGDPSGKTDERQLLTAELVAENVEGIRKQLEHHLDFDCDTNPAITVNNLDWLGGLGLIDFLRDIGKHFSVNMLMKKESVRRRLENEETGISYTEFSYALLQAYDFLELNRRYDCTLQMGGSDQWGNITAGIDLIRRETRTRAHGLTYPLMTNAAGRKFGKSEDGNVWLDPELTSPYRFYQFWVNVDDRDVAKFTRFFSLRSREEIEALEVELAERPHERAAHRALAEEMTARVHGAAGLDRAKRASEVLFGGSLEGLGADDIADIFSDVPSHEVARTELETGLGVVDLLAQTELVSSRGDARRSIEGGGVYLNNGRVENVETTVDASHAVEGRFLVLRKGKKRYHLVRVRG
jgi:tyrosyl-tRNA synthetase